MINFFRKIRLRSANENRVGKYLKYAIGEIILVVIGILIALSINSWNHDRLESLKEDGYLENLERDLENQLNSIAIQVSYEQKYVDAAQPILNNYERDQYFIVDSLFTSGLSTIEERKTFVKVSPTYQDLISSGNISLIKNSFVRNAVLEYYLELERYERIVQNNNTLITDERYGNGIVKLVYLAHLPSEKLTDYTKERLKDPEIEMELLNLLGIRAGVAATHIQFMNELRDMTEKMLSVLKDSRQ